MKTLFDYTVILHCNFIVQSVSIALVEGDCNKVRLLIGLLAESRVINLLDGMMTRCYISYGPIWEPDTDQRSKVQLMNHPISTVKCSTQTKTSEIGLRTIF